MGAWKGMWPVTMKARSTPSAQMSTGGPRYDSSRNNSGAAYGGEPQNVLSCCCVPRGQEQKQNQVGSAMVSCFFFFGSLNVSVNVPAVSSVLKPKSPSLTRGRPRAEHVLRLDVPVDDAPTVLRQTSGQTVTTSPTRDV